MKRSGASISGIIVTGLLILLLSACVAAGLLFAAPLRAFAEGEQTTEGETTPEEDADTGITINKTDFNITLKTDTVEYNGKQDNYPEVQIIYNNKVLTEGTDYTLSSDIYTVGTAELTITGIGEYSGSVTYAYGIVKANNYWVETPSILSWVWGSYTEGIGNPDAEPEFITAEPAVGAESMVFIISKSFGNFQGVGEPVYFVNESGVRGYTFTFDEDGKLPEYMIEGLKNLDAGKYYLNAMISETKNYTSLSANEKFEVMALTNYWEASPNIIQWNWNEFDRSVNTVTAKPKYTLPDNYVSFAVYTDSDCLAESKVIDLFELDGGNIRGKIPTSYLDGKSGNPAEEIKNLDAGTYYLCAYYYGDGNISALRTPIQFTVQKVQNHWETTPNIVQWRWDEYDAEVNKITAMPYYGNQEDVVFGIFNLYNFPVSRELERFSYIKKLEPTTNPDGSFAGNVLTYAFSEEVAKQIAELDAGTYQLRATLADSNNYSGLGGASVQFTVQNVQNNWTETPAVLSWKYGEYDKSFNKITGAAAYGEEVVFVIYDKDVEKLLFSDNGNIVDSFVLEDGLVPDYVAQRLKTLGVGTYYLLVSVEGTQNYTGLNNYTDSEDIKKHGIEFEVTTSTNSWVTLPSVLGWNEGNFDINVNAIVAKAANGNDGMIIRVYDDKDNLITSNENGNEIDYNVISKLGVGSYKVTFEVAGTNNYTALTGEIAFAVSEDSVALTGIITAAVVFAVFDIAAAGVCVFLIIRRRKKIEQGYREMIRRELNGGKV